MVSFASEEGIERRVTTVDGIELTWIAQLKPAHAQRIAEALGRELTRVGLDESEWLRRHGLRADKHKGEGKRWGQP